MNQNVQERVSRLYKLYIRIDEKLYLQLFGRPYQRSLQAQCTFSLSFNYV